VHNIVIENRCLIPRKASTQDHLHPSSQQSDPHLTSPKHPLILHLLQLFRALLSQKVHMLWLIIIYRWLSGSALCVMWLYPVFLACSTYRSAWDQGITLSMHFSLLLCVGGGELCFLCDNPTDVRFQPCGHSAMCSECAPRAKRCPTCRNPVDGIEERCISCAHKWATVTRPCGHKFCSECDVKLAVCLGCSQDDLD